MVKIEKVSKSFRSKRNKVDALKEVSFLIERPSLVVLVGLNGSGKTTLLKTIAGLLSQDSGSVEVGNQDIGFIFDSNQTFYPRLSVIENINYFSKIQNNSKNTKENTDLILKKLNLFEKKDVATQTLSRGMRTKLGIAIALLNNPGILIFDEPTLGLDVESVEELKKIIIKLKEEDKYIIVSTHHFEFINEIYDHLLILDRGNIVFSHTRDYIEKNEDLLYSIRFVNSNEKLIEKILKFNNFSNLLNFMNQEDIKILDKIELNNNDMYTIVKKYLEEDK